jgi:hypothetical protein
MTFKLKAILTIIIVFFALASPATALERSKFFPAFLIISGVVLKFGSVYLETQANEAYDNYLHTAIQAELEEYTDEYDSKHTQSVIASQVGSGFWALAVFISLYRQFSSISVENISGSLNLGTQNSAEDKLDLLSSSVNMQTKIRRPSNGLYARNGNALFVISRKF